MTNVPRSALILGFAGVLPFLWGVATMLVPQVAQITVSTVGARFLGPFVLYSYGIVILCFMSGVLWGFAAAHDGKDSAVGYGLSVLPALWAFFMVGGNVETAAINLITGFIGVLMIDWHFWRQGLTPTWWMGLRIPLTLLVCFCLLVGVF